MTAPREGETPPYEVGSPVSVLRADSRGDVHAHSGTVTAIAPDFDRSLWHIDTVTEQGEVVHALVDSQGIGGRVMPDGEVSKEIAPMTDDVAYLLMREGEGTTLEFGQPEHERTRQRGPEL